MNKCKFCGYKIEGDRHDCPKTGKTYTRDGSDGDFLLSAAIGAVTGSALLGGFLGGDFLGGFVGDALDGDIFD